MNKIISQKHIYSGIFILILLSALSSCSSVKKTRRLLTARTINIATNPIIADIKIEDIKKTGTATNNSDISFELIRNAAICDLLQKNNGDVLIAPFYIIKKDGNQTTVSVKGFVGRYFNIRVDTATVNQDSILSKQSSKNIKQKASFSKDREAKIELINAVNSLNEKIYVPSQKLIEIGVTETPIKLENTSKENNQYIPSVDKNDNTKNKTNVENKKNHISNNVDFVADSLITENKLKVNKKAKDDSTINDYDGETIEIKKPQGIGKEIKIGNNKYIGGVKNNVPHGLGTIYYNTKTKISVINNLDVYARKGDYLTGRWFNGELEYGVLYDSEGEMVSKITIGR